MEAMKELDQWVLWERRGDKKPPVEPSGKLLKWKGRKEFYSYDQVMVWQSQGRGDGIGFFFVEGGPYVGIDLDGCLFPDGSILPWAQEILEAADSYAEISPSGNGVKIFGRGQLAHPIKKMISDHVGIEVYSHGRYFTVTENQFEDCATLGNIQNGLESAQRIANKWNGKTPPVTPETAPEGDLWTVGGGDDLEVIQQLRNQKNGAKFTALFDGGHVGDPSSDDMSLCNMIVFVTRDPAQIDRIFRKSACYRDKWDRKDYRDRTISKALAYVTEERKSKPSQPSEPLSQGGVSLVSWEQIDKEIKEMVWYWPNFLAPNFAHLVVSHSGVGKSWYLLALSKIIATGANFPDGSPNPYGEPRPVLFMETENATSLIASRIKSMGIPFHMLDAPRFHDNQGNQIDFKIDDPEHRAMVEELAVAKDWGLIIFDSLRGMPGRHEEKSEKSGERVKWIQGIAQDAGLPVVASHHFRKPGGNTSAQVIALNEPTLFEVSGSSNIGGMASHVLGLWRCDPADTGRVGVNILKNRFGPDFDRITLRIEGGNAVITNEEPPKPAQVILPRDAAKEFLLATLKDGRVAIQEIKELAEDEEIADRTLTRARQDLNVKTVQIGGVHYWEL